MSKMHAVYRTILVAMIVSSAALASGQESLVLFRNRMQSTTDVKITRVGSTNTTPITIVGDATIRFFFTGKRYDIQVIPRDEPLSGYQFANVDLRELAANAEGGIVTLDGAFAPSRWRVFCYSDECGCYGCTERCFYQWVRGERTAVGLSATRKNGQPPFSIEVPKVTY